MNMRVIEPGKVPTSELHQFLLGAVSPRPIAFASTIDEQGNPNLAPYSFFNCFSSNPPIVVFSSNRRVSDNTTKDTLHNIRETGEVVINAVNYAIVRQMAVASIQYDAGVSEFVKAGLTPVPADLIAPFRVKESPAHLECKVQQIIPLGEQGGAGHLIICEVVRMHVSEEVLDEEGKIDPHKMDLVGRMGRAFYTRASGDAIFKVFQPVTRLGIGFDQLPGSVRNSAVLTGNDLAQLAGLPDLPDQKEVLDIMNIDRIKPLLKAYSHEPFILIERLHEFAKEVIQDGNPELAIKVAMIPELL